MLHRFGGRRRAAGARCAPLAVELVEAATRHGIPDLEALAGRVGMIVVDGVRRGVACSVREGTAGFVASVDPSLPPHGRRFALAWAIAATAFRPWDARAGMAADRSWRTGGDAGRDRDLAAGAASILMPWRATTADPAFRRGDAAALAKAFGVGPALAAVRLRDLAATTGCPR